MSRCYFHKVYAKVTRRLIQQKSLSSPVLWLRVWQRKLCLSKNGDPLSESMLIHQHGNNGKKRVIKECVDSIELLLGHGICNVKITCFMCIEKLCMWRIETTHHQRCSMQKDENLCQKKSYPFIHRTSTQNSFIHMHERMNVSCILILHTLSVHKMCKFSAFMQGSSPYGFYSFSATIKFEWNKRITWMLKHRSHTMASDHTAIAALHRMRGKNCEHCLRHKDGWWTRA